MVVAVVCAIVAYSGTPIGLAQQNSIEQQLIQVERDWCTAQLKKDAALLGRILADDYTGVNSRSIAETKIDALSGLKDKTSTITACVDSNVKVRLYGDAAVVTGLATRSGTFNGAPFKDRQFLWTDTFIRKDGRWQCVASQSTLIAAQQK
jgi:hypothetical protein